LVLSLDEQRKNEKSNHQDDNQVIFEQFEKIFIYFTFPDGVKQK